MPLKASDRVQAVEKAIDLLFCFSINEPELSLQDFVNKTGMNKTTVFRLLSSLQEKGLIIKDENTKIYKIGLSVISLAQIVNESLDIRKEAFQFMKQLAQETQETISLNIVQANKRICIEKVDGYSDIREFVRLGYPYSLSRGASGKLLLAYSDVLSMESTKQEWEWYLDETDDILSLRNELEQIRMQGYSISLNERISGAYAISVPIFGMNNRLLAGLSISGLSTMLSKEKQELFVHKAKKYASIISNKMGHTTGD